MERGEGGHIVSTSSTSSNVNIKTWAYTHGNRRATAAKGAGDAVAFWHEPHRVFKRKSERHEAEESGNQPEPESVKANKAEKGSTPGIAHTSATAGFLETQPSISARRDQAQQGQTEKRRK